MKHDFILAEEMKKMDEMSQDPSLDWNLRTACGMRYKYLKDEAIGMKEVEIRIEAKGELKQ